MSNSTDSKIHGKTQKATLVWVKDKGWTRTSENTTGPKVVTRNQNLVGTLLSTTNACIKSDDSSVATDEDTIKNKPSFSKTMGLHRGQATEHRNQSEPTTIMVLGSSHSGTTILKSIIGRAERCNEFLGELRSKKISEYKKEVSKSSASQNCDFVVVKRPPSGLYTSQEHFHPGWANTIRILITRNPVMVCNSWNERRTPYRDCPTRFKQLENIVGAISDRRFDPRIYYIRYEDLFTNNFQNLREILDSIGLKYNDTIFNTKDRGAISHRGLKYVSKTRPLPAEHENYRTWQINQPFVNFDEDKKITSLTTTQKEWLTSSSILNELYPNIPKLISKSKISKASRSGLCLK